MCCPWIKKIRWGKVLLAGFVYLIIAFIIRQIEAILTMNYYLTPEYFSVWSKVMMPKAGPPPLSFHIISAVFTLFTGVTLAAVYDLIKGVLSPSRWGRVCGFTGIVLWLSFVLFTLTTYLLVNLPLMLLVWWLVATAVVYFLAAIVFERILK